MSARRLSNLHTFIQLSRSYGQLPLNIHNPKCVTNTPCKAIIGKNLMSSMANRDLFYDDIVKLSKNKEIFLVDVREPSEIQETGKLPGSVHIPLGDVPSALALDATSFEQKYGTKKPDSDSPLVFSCRSGKRSQIALKGALDLGYSKFSSMAFEAHQIQAEDIEPLATQVGGHTFSEGKNSIGMLKHKDGYVLKPLRKTYGKNEVDFYKTLPSSTFKGLQPFIPRFFGTATLNINSFCGDVIILEDLVGGLQKPCVMDVKIGKQTWDPFATAEKIENEKKKYVECKRDFSFCIPGFQVYAFGSNQPLKFGKEHGKSLNKETVFKTFSEFLNLEKDENAAKIVIQHFISELQKILSVLSSQTNLHIYSSSILLTYDCAKLNSLEPVQSWARVHMIDFAHAFPSSSLNKGKDENYLDGLTSLIDVLKKLLQ